MDGSGTRRRVRWGVAIFALALVLGPSACVVTVPRGSVPVDAHGSPMQVSDLVQRAAAVQSVLAMTNAERAVAFYVAEQGSPEGISAVTLASYEPSVLFNASPTAVEGQVSVRVVPPASVILATRDPNGDPYCSVLEYGEMIGRGHVDAHAPAECTGGWPGEEWDLPPLPSGIPSLPPGEYPEPVPPVAP